MASAADILGDWDVYVIREVANFAFWDGLAKWHVSEGSFADLLGATLDAPHKVASFQ